MEPIRSLLSALNQLVTTTGVVWWRCLPRLLVTAMLGWLGYRIFAQAAALVVDVSAWWSLLLLSIGFVVRLSAIIIGLRIAGEQLQIRAAIPLPDDDPRDDSMSHLLSITLLPFLGIYAVFDVITDAANHIQIDYYVFSGLTFERQVLSQFNPEGAGVWLIVGVIVGLYVVRRLVEAWFERTGFRPLGLVTAVTEGFFIMIVLLSGRQVLVMVQQWVDDRNFRVWLDYPGWGLQQVCSWVGVDISDVLDQLGSLWFDTVWPGVVAMVVEPMLWLALASLVYGSQVLSAADLWRRGRPVTLGAGRSGVRIGDRERGVALGFQDAFFGDLNDKYLPTFQSLRLVLSVGATFFAAYLLCYGVLTTGEEWLSRGFYALIGGQRVSFWSFAAPPIELLVEVIAEPLRWVLLATAFHACLVLYAARVDEEVATEPGDGVSTRSTGEDSTGEGSTSAGSTGVVRETVNPGAEGASA